MKLILTSIILLIATFSFAQRQNVYFLRIDGKYVDSQDSADYIRIVREPDSASVLYNVFEFYKSGTRKLISKSSTIDPPTFEGQTVMYYPNGKAKERAIYKKGQETGPEFEFYPNGKPYQVMQYPENQAETDSYDDHKDNYLITANYDSLGNVQVENGNGYYKAYDSEFKYIYDEGVVKNGKRDGVWKGKLKSAEVTFSETYENGNLINGTGTFDDGTVTTYTKTRSTVPEFKGGLVAFYKYLAGHVYYPDYAREHNIQGQVIVSFVVEKDGKISELKVAKSATELLDLEAVRVLKRSPVWVPGTRFGRPVRVRYSVPVKFSLSE